MSEFDDEEYESFELDGAGEPAGKRASRIRLTSSTTMTTMMTMIDEDEPEDATDDEIDFVLAAYREDGQPFVQSLAQGPRQRPRELIVQLRRLPG